MLESNPSAWQGSAGDKEGDCYGHPLIILWLSLPEPKMLILHLILPF
ncbi:hypothetical protein L9W92_12660 [Pelotomaculum terephthalicicum JT]|nr:MULTISPECIES: hypothetical protein [Pelotomaculum]MCG9968887.1 hypothetical protein [Pelotomaculum terephthalicicum JT]OPX87454.1 MAG: hypothetical protein A4E54_01665 [Pelotomaculum sp. PtaB.Bin117]OPY61581.1 MAG: hypothetical protein A4E56_01941 [Pelotomaculum sp. PtaU1.Bin065]